MEAIIGIIFGMIYLYGRTHRKYRVRHRYDGYVAERTGNIFFNTYRPVQYVSTIIFHYSESEELYEDVVFKTEEKAQKYIERCRQANRDLTPPKPLYTNDVCSGPNVIER